MMMEENILFHLTGRQERDTEKPGVIAISEYDPEKKEIIGYPKRIWRGGTDRGCIEALILQRETDIIILCVRRAARDITTV